MLKPKNQYFVLYEEWIMKQTNLIVLAAGIICFVVSFIFMMPWDLYNKSLFQMLLITAIVLVALSLYLDGREKKKAGK